MQDNFLIQEHKKVSISTGDSLRSIEIADSAVDSGFLTRFPGASLAIFLYLVTHVDNNNLINTNSTLISSFLADSFQISDINKGLKFLDDHDIIDISKDKEGDYSYQIRLKLEKLNIANTNNSNTTNNIASQHQLNQVNSASQVNHSNQKNIWDNKNPYFNQNQIRLEVLDTSNVSRSELFKAILTFIPPEENLTLLENRITQWLEDFDSKMIKELIRRVSKWLDKYNNPPNKGFHYLKGIVDDWYQKDIKNYDELKYYDQLYRETRELASLYGLKEWRNIKPTHLKTFQKWLKEGFPLSVELIKLAIQEAFRRKKDGQASLQYIEDNFIMPWKEKKIRNSKQAKRLLNSGKSKKQINRQGNYKQANNKDSDQLSPDNWDKVDWDF